MNAPDPTESRIQEGFAVAALVLGEDSTAPLADGLVVGAPIAAALEPARRLASGERRAFLRSVLRPRVQPALATLPAASRAAARARALLSEAPAKLSGTALRARRGYTPDPQLVAWLGRAWSSALRTEAR